MPYKKRKITPSQRCAFWPCDSCRRDCSHGSIYCNSCTTWFHNTCEGLDDFPSLDWSSIPTYTCLTCFSEEAAPPYSFNAALLRLSQRKTRPVASATGKPVKSLTDGDCLFSSVSIAVCGNNSMVTELRVRTCLEMILNKPHYMQLPNVNDIISTSPAFDDAASESAKSKTFSSMWTVYALSSASNHTIEVVYPAVNGPSDFGCKALNVKCTPRRACIDKTISIMWTSCAGLRRSGENRDLWRSDHFVPIIPPMPRCHSSPVSADAVHSMYTTLDGWKDDDVMNVDSDAGSDSVDTKTHEAKTVHTAADQSFFDNNISGPLCLGDDSDVSSRSEDDEDLSQNDATSSYTPLPGAEPLQGSFLDTPVVINHILQRETALERIPRGVKSNVFFVVDNSQNALRRASGKNSLFVDDCGAWKSSSSKKHLFTRVNNKYVYVDKKNGVYMVTVKGKRIPMDPQPAEGDIITLKRVYTSLKRAPEFKRRISWIEGDIPSDLTRVTDSAAIFEYLGKFPTAPSIHGNRTKSSGEYVRTTREVRDNIQEKTKTSSPHEVYEELALNGSMCAPRDLKQVQNYAYKRQETGLKPQNTADELQTLLSDMATNEYQQEVIQSKDGLTNIILYTEQQLEELKNFCSNPKGSSVIGVDRTFNLGSVFLTVIVYQNTNLLRKTTHVAPIMLGPCYMHWNGSYDTYHCFFSHLQRKLSGDVHVDALELGGDNLILGSDEEAALMKAMKQCFPNATHVLCRRHIEENIRRKLQQVGSSETTTNTVLDEIFGLLASKTEYEYDLLQMEVGDKIETELPSFLEYFEKAAELLKDKLWRPHIRKFTPLNWKNNSCESMNYIIKLRQNWKTLQLPQLRDKLYRLVQLQYRDVRAALHGQGNYELAPWTRKFQVTQMCWVSKSEEEKKKMLTRLLRFRHVNEKAIISSDGNLQIPKTPRTAKNTWAA